MTRALRALCTLLTLTGIVCASLPPATALRSATGSTLHQSASGIDGRWQLAGVPEDPLAVISGERSGRQIAGSRIELNGVHATPLAGSRARLVSRPWFRSATAHRTLAVDVSAPRGPPAARLLHA